MLGTNSDCLVLGTSPPIQSVVEFSYMTFLNFLDMSVHISFKLCLHASEFYRYEHLNNVKIMSTDYIFLNFLYIKIQIVIKLSSKFATFFLFFRHAHSIVLKRLTQFAHFRFLRHAHSNRAKAISTIYTFSNFLDKCIQIVLKRSA